MALLATKPTQIRKESIQHTRSCPEKQTASRRNIYFIRLYFIEFNSHLHQCLKPRKWNIKSTEHFCFFFLFAPLYSYLSTLKYVINDLYVLLAFGDSWNCNCVGPIENPRGVCMRPQGTFVRNNGQYTVTDILKAWVAPCAARPFHFSFFFPTCVCVYSVISDHLFVCVCVKIKASFQNKM